MSTTSDRWGTLFNRIITIKLKAGSFFPLEVGGIKRVLLKEKSKLSLMLLLKLAQCRVLIIQMKHLLTKLFRVTRSQILTFILLIVQGSLKKLLVSAKSMTTVT